MCLVSLFNYVNLTVASYFVDGTNLSDEKLFFSWDSLFSSTLFPSYFYMALIIGMGTLVSDVMVAKLFKPIDTATA